MSPRSERDWRLYAEDILEACGKVRRFVGGMTYEAFVADDRTRDTVLRNIEIIGEAAKNEHSRRHRGGSAGDCVAQRPRNARRAGSRLLRCVARDHLGHGDDTDGLTPRLVFRISP